MYVAVDIGGTKTLIALLNDAGEIERSQKYPTDELFDDFIGRLTSTLQNDFFSDDIKGIAVAAPGQIDYESGEGLLFGNLMWHNVPIGKRLSEHFSVPVVVENDANAAGLAEVRLLDPTPACAVYVTVSTGIGTGVITDGNIDKHLRKSEGGFMHFDVDGHLQAWEDFASGRAIYERYNTYARDLEDEEAWRKSAYNIALGLSNIAALIQPQTIVIGGSIGNYFQKYEHHLHDAMKQIKERMYAIPQIVQAKHPEEAVIYGCYHLLKDEERGHGRSNSS